MALAFIIIGAVLVASAIQNTQAQLGQLLVSDFTGSSSFLYWVAALFIIGMIGYVPALRTPSRWFLGLLVVVFALTNGTGFFSRLQSGLQNPQQVTPPTVATPTSGIPISIGGGSATSGIGQAASAVGSVAGLFSL